MAKKKKRITFENSPAPPNNAFADLPLEGLPEAPEQPEIAPITSATESLPTSVCLRREKAHRGGKTVIVVYDFPSNFSTEAMENLAKQLKQHCGCGGAVKQHEIILQGDKAQEITAFLDTQGIRAKGVTK